MTNTREQALAYLLGAYLSDGHLALQKYTNFHAQWPATSLHPADSISIALSDLGCLHSYNQYFADRYKKGQYWRIEERAQCSLGEWLYKTTGEKESLPVVPKELIRPLVAGLMDGDGCVASRDLIPCQLSYAGSKEFVKDFYRLLQKQGVRVGQVGRMKGGVYYWYINIESFLATGLNFAMPRKQARLASWCGRMCRLAKSRGRSDDLRKASVARWWMREVWSKDLFAPYPTGKLIGVA